MRNFKQHMLGCMAVPSSSMAIVDYIPQSGTMNLARASNVVFHYFCTFLVLLQFCKRTRKRLSLSPATLFSGGSLPNHTKMFELVHLVTSVEDFGERWRCYKHRCCVAVCAHREYCRKFAAPVRKSFRIN